ncbi:prolyl-tRNA synthetase associated domain-containing protein [Photobacterium toruni]|uniref:Prolyl-tRNA editing protein ProX n=1 Tax=Photobacterium toruni TaxID=1935446 RepID=A0A1T4UZ66_9GAMM|nr:prolyl-tRNA synthetase associated domain-containing protein [Photobacterium toruni]SKA58033.1 Prolyl-tRNA editing protein ProX [Photobacterium toruni]
MDIYKILDDLDIDYKKFLHPAVFNCEQAHLLALDIDGVATKNLFIKNKKGDRHFLIIMMDDKTIDFKRLSQRLNVSGLSFASSHRLDKYLGTSTGSVSLLDIIKDTQAAVELIIDKSIFNYSAIQCHPFTNTATLEIPMTGIHQLLAHYQRQYTEIEI